MAGESSSSSDEEHNAALRSVAIDSHSVIEFATLAVPSSGRKAFTSNSSRKCESFGNDEDAKKIDSSSNGGLKLYQIRVQDLLHEHLDKYFGEPPVKIADVSNEVERSDIVTDDLSYDGETQLFSNGSMGVALKRKNVQKGSRPRVRIRPAFYDSSEEVSTEQDSRFQTISIESTTVKMQAREAQTKAFARFLAAEAVSQNALKTEEERVACLKKIRGEEWLPSVAKKMVKEIKTETERRKWMSSSAMIGTVANYKV